MTKALDKAIERMKPGTVLEVVEQTKRPELIGSHRTVVKHSHARIWEVTSDHTTPATEQAMELPRSNVQWLDDNTITYPLLGGKGIGAGHTVTLRFITEGAA